jgi:hypothetical protein
MTEADLERSQHHMVMHAGTWTNDHEVTAHILTSVCIMPNVDNLFWHHGITRDSSRSRVLSPLSHLHTHSLMTYSTPSPPTQMNSLNDPLGDGTSSFCPHPSTHSSAAFSTALTVGEGVSGPADRHGTQPDLECACAHNVPHDMSAHTTFCQGMFWLQLPHGEILHQSFSPHSFPPQTLTIASTNTVRVQSP